MTSRFHHLQNINQTYLQHLRNAIGYSMLCQKASIIFMVHALCPDWFVDNGSNTIKDLQKQLSSHSDSYNVSKNVK